MKTKSFTKRIVICLVAFVSLILASFGLSKPSAPINVDAASSITIPNGNFTSTSGSKMPYGVSNFTATQTMQNKDGDNINGIIDLSKDGDYKDYKGAYANTNYGLKDPYVLMINGEKQDSYFGYTTTDGVSLSADSFYSITINVFTENNNGIAYIYLYDEDGRVIGSIDHLNGKWDSYAFLISTNELQSKTVKLGLFAKGRGVAMFDNIVANQIDKSTLTSRMENFDAQNIPYCHVNLRSLEIKEDYLSANKQIFSKFGYSETDDKQVTRHAYLTANDDIEIKNGNKPSALLIQNSKSSYVTFMSTNNYLNFEANNVYSVTICAKTVGLSGQASFKLVEAVEKFDGVDSDEITISSSTNTFTNYTFYVRASSLSNKNYNILVSLGTSSNGAVGKLYISSIKVSKINYSTFNAGSNKLDLASNETANSSNYFTNGNFNQLEINDLSNPLPAGATGWTANLGKDRQVHGIVNTSASSFATMLENNDISILNPGSSDGISNNNLLLLYNTTADSLSYTSSTINIAKDSYKKLSLDLRSVHANVTIDVVYKDGDVETILASKTVSADSSWADGNTNFYIYSPYQSLDVSLRIKIETSSWGGCFVDNVRYFSSNQAEFASHGDSVNLSNLLSSNSNKDFADALFFTKPSAKASVGIVNSQTSTIFDEPTQLAALRNLPNSAKNSSVLAVYAEEESYLSLTSKLGFAVPSGDGEYYKLSVSIYTPYLTSENDDNEFGVGIALTNFEENSKNLKSLNGWQTYSFYISADNETTSKLVLSVGDENSQCAGYAFFGNISFEKLPNISSVEDFENLAKKDGYGILLNKVVKSDTETDENAEQAQNNNSGINWWYFIPSIIFALAIIICVVGVLVRKVKWKKPSKKVKNAYDRNKTVSVQYYTRKATQEREVKLHELQKELDDLTNQRSTYEEEYKHDLTTMRELKIKRASANEIAKLDKDMRKNRKMASAIGLNVKRVENEIDYVKSPAYLNSLIKKMSNEKQVVETSQTSETSDAEDEQTTKKA